MIEWISVTERLPRPDERVLVWTDEGMCFAVFRQDRREQWVETTNNGKKRTEELREIVDQWWQTENDTMYSVTHWAVDGINPPCDRRQK